MTASTFAAGVPGGAPTGPVAEAGVGAAGLDDAGLDDAGLDDAGLDDAGLDDAGLDDAGPVGVGWAARRLVRAAEGAGGTLATAAWKGCPAQDPPAAEPHAADVCRAVTVPGAADGAPEPEAWARYRPPATSTGSPTRPYSRHLTRRARYLARRAGPPAGFRPPGLPARWRAGLPVGTSTARLGVRVRRSVAVP